MKDLYKQKYWIWFSMLKGIGILRKKEILKRYGDPKELYFLSKKELLNIPMIGDKLSNKILENDIRERLDETILDMQENKINFISINDEEYPTMLKEIYDPPIGLYVKGNIEILKDSAISIVGCRDVSDYGKKASTYFSYELTKQGKNIVSGLAKGVDTYAHLGNIYANLEDEKGIINYGKTIAVVGNGLDIIYPKENKLLEKKIIEMGGAIVSEYPNGTKPSRMNFPARNRIVSGLSKGVLVIEAKRKSGTLITVDFALEQGREVYAIPGNINSPNSVGTNELIKQGANIVTNKYDIKI